MVQYIPGKHTARIRPIAPGCSISAWYGTVCTLGCFVLFKGYVGLLTAAHGLADPDPNAPPHVDESLVLQPGVHDAGRTKDNQIASVVWRNDKFAVAWVLDQELVNAPGLRGWTPIVPGIGSITGRMTAHVGQRVIGVGRTSGLISATVIDTNASVPLRGSWVHGMGLLDIATREGDSGMALLDAELHRLVGIVEASTAPTDEIASIPGSKANTYFWHERDIPDDILVVTAS